MKYLILTFFLVIAANYTRATTDFNGNCRKAYHQIICLRFDEARRTIDTEKTARPSNTIPYLLDNYIDFLTVMIGEEDKDLERMRQNRDSRLQQLVKGDPSSPWFLYCQADLYLQFGFARVKFGEYVSAAMDINRAFRLLEQNNRKFPDFTPDKIRLGLLHALVGTVPDKYTWAISALDFKGTIPQGIRELSDAYTTCRKSSPYDFLLPEASFTLSLATMNLSGDRKAINRIIDEFKSPELATLLHQSPLVCYTLANLDLKSGRNDQAIDLLENRPQGSGFFPFSYLDYLLGVAKLNRLDGDAYLPLMKFVGDFRGRNYIRSAYEHLAWYYLVQNDAPKARFYMDRIRLRGYSMVDNDRQALKNAEKKDPPDPLLLKARLLFDGGYYDKALSELNLFGSSPGMSQPRLKLEYTYRNARTCDELEKTDEAIEWYTKTMNLGSSDPSYFAANSALHLGLIFEERKSFDQARQNYKKCLAMDFDEFHFSITQKAKSGLNRISNR